MKARKEIGNLLLTITVAAWITVPGSIHAASQTFYVSTQAVGTSSDSDFYIAENATMTLVDTTELIAGGPVTAFANSDRRIYLKFDLTGLPTMGTVTNAILRLWWKAGSWDKYGDAVVFARTAEFVPGGSSDYAELVGDVLGTIASGDAPAGGTWKELDITAAVEAWRSSGLSTYFGLAIQGSEGFSDTGKYFDSRTGVNPPQLVVHADEPAGTISQTFYVSTQAVGTSSDSDFYIAENATMTLVDTTELIAGSPSLGNTDRRIYLKFDLTGLTAMGPVINATLRLWRKVGTYDEFGNAHVFARTAEFVPGGSSDYDELAGNELGIISSNDVPSGAWKELNITAAVEAWRSSGLSTYFGLAIQGSEGYTQTGKYFDSRTGANPPQLVVHADEPGGSVFLFE